MNDLHATEISTPVVGCKIVYLRGSLSWHSGIVTEINNGNVIVVSKWGGYGLYRHKYDDVPPEYKDLDGNFNVHYYIIDTSHSLPTNYVYKNSVYHHKVCSICNTSVQEPHTFTNYTSQSSSSHSKYCSICNTTMYEGHTFYQSGVWYTCFYCGYKTKNPSGQISSYEEGA